MADDINSLGTATGIDGEARSGFLHYMDALSASLPSPSGLTVNEIVASAYLVGRLDALRELNALAAPACDVNARLVALTKTMGDEGLFNRGYAAGSEMVLKHVADMYEKADSLSEDAAVFSMLHHPSREGVVAR